MFQQIGQWFDDYLRIPGLPAWLGVIILGLSMALVSIALTAIALLFIPVNYFAGPDAPRYKRNHHPILRWALFLIRNVVGWMLIIIGIILSLPGVPGQGILTILLGAMLAAFPGKRRFEMWLIRKDRVHRTVNGLRARFGKRALDIDHHSVVP